MYRWIFFLVNEIEQPLWRIAHHESIDPKEKRLPQEWTLSVRNTKEMVAVFERHMKEREYIVGARLSVAFFNAAYTLDWANEQKMLIAAPRRREFLKSM